MTHEITTPAAVNAGPVNAGPEAPPPPDSRRWLALGVIAVAELMVVLDGTVMNIALPSAQQALGISDADRQWVITAYLLAFGGLLLLGGRIADYMGRKRAFLIGLVGFAGASALGGAATNAATLYTARGLQGAFGALLAPAALSLLTVAFTDEKERAKAFGVFGAVSGVGSGIGVIAGGVLTEYASWRWALFVNVPIALVAVAAAVPIVRASRASGNTRYDVPGAVLATGGLTALVYGFTKAASEADHWTAPVTIGWLAAAAVLLAGFLVWESRVANPLLPLRVLWDRNRGASYLVLILSSGAMLGMFLCMTYYMQVTLHYSALRTGVAYLPFSGGVVVGVGIASALLPKVGPRVLVTVGAVLGAAAMAWLTRLDLTSSYASQVLPAFIVMAIGLGMMFVPLPSTALSGIDDHDAGVASAMVNTSQQIGNALGTALLNTFFASALASYLATHAATPLTEARAVIHGYVVALWVGVALFAAAAVLTVLFIRKPVKTVTTLH